MPSGSDKELFGRVVKLVISSPSTDPKNFNGTLRDELTIGGGENNAQGVKEPGLRVAFRIHKNLDKTPNTSEITVYNLNPTNRAKLQQRGLKVTLEAGYETTGLSRLLRGDLRYADNKRSGADWISTITVGDGERAYKHARVQQSFSSKATGADVLRYLADASGLQIGNVPDALLDLTVRYDHGYVVSGRWCDEMARFCRSVGYNYSTQDETLQMLLPMRKSKAAGKRIDNFIVAEIPEISVDTGMIGSAEFGTPEKKGQPRLLKFKALLRPTLVGAKVRLKSDTYTGNVIVRKCSHEGDTHDKAWFTNYEGLLEKNKNG